MNRFPLLVLLASTGCVEAPEYVYGESLGTLEFHLYSPDMGVWPDASVLQDPNNPFQEGLGRETKWDVNDDGPVAAFYGWATVLAGESTGEHQFYAASSAHLIYDVRLADTEDLVYVRDIAIRGYQNVLDFWPDAVTYSADLRNTYPLAPQAFLGIEALGGTVQGGWVYVEDSDGNGTVTRPE